MSDTMDTGSGLEIVAGIKAAVGDLSTALAQERASRMQSRPVPYRVAKSGQVPSNGATIGIGLGGPQLGRMWHVRRLAISGSQWSTTVAGTGEVYVTTLDSAAMALIRDASQLVDQASGTTPALPSNAFYGQGEIVVVHPEHISIVIVGGTDSTQYIVSLQSEDFSNALAPEVVSV